MSETKRLGKISLSESGASHYPEKETHPGWFFFELRTPDEGTDSIIEDRVWFNNEGSLRADRDILADALTAGLISSRGEGVTYSDVYKMYDVTWC